MISEKEPVSTTDLYQIALLIDQLKHDDRSFRINAHKNLIKIADALGPERTRKELIPFLSACCDDDDDVLAIMAEQMGSLAGHIGGPEFAHVLLGPLEILLTSEDGAVRDAAIQSLRVVCDSMPEMDHVIPVIRRIATKDCFSSRISASIAIPFFYSKPGASASAKRDLEELFFALCEDDVPIVRRFAATNLGVMCVKMGHLTKDFHSMLVRLSQDVQDTVRTQTVIACGDIALKFPKDVVIRDIVPCFCVLASDKSWRIRWTAANSLDSLCRCLGTDAATQHFAPVYDSLVHDSEPEVRAISMLKMASIVSCFRTDVVILKFVPALHKFVSDVSEHVRVSISKSINNLATIFSKTDTIEYILPIILLLLRDQSSEVRLNIISNLSPVNDVIGVELLSQSLLPSILNLAEDTKWRVRQSIILIIPVLAEQLGRDFLSEKLGETCLNWLVDSVHTVRVSAAENIRRLFCLFGEDWLKDNIFPRLERMLVHSNYLHRMSALFTIQQLASLLSKSMVDSSVVPLLIQMSTDSVANIRMCVGRLILALASSPRPELSQGLSRLTPTIAQLETDKDPDARLIAQKVAGMLR